MEMTSHLEKGSQDISLDNIGKDSTDTNRQRLSHQLKVALTPLVSIMKMFGLIFGDVFPDSETSNANSIQGAESQMPLASVRSNKWRQDCTWTIGKVYSFCVWLGLFALTSSSLSFTVRASDFETIARRLSFDIFFLFCALQVLVCALTISSKPNGSRFTKFVKVTERAILSSDIEPPTPKYATVGKYVGLCALILNAFLFDCLLLFPFTRTMFMDFVFGDETIAVPHGNSSWAPLMITVLSVHMSAAWLFPNILYIVTCLIIAQLFHNLTEKASKTLKGNSGMIDVSLLRADHQSLCRAVDALDGVLSPLGAVSYGCNIPLVCLLLNASILMVDKNVDPFQIATIVFWNVMNISITTLCSLAGAHLHTKAHSLTEIIYDVDLKKLDSLQRSEMMVLLTKLNLETISPTIGGTVPVTKGMILTVFGTIVGYLTILVQFK